jgi:hypothetical protein
MTAPRAGSLRLTDAVRPADGQRYELREGYRTEVFRGRGGERCIPVLAANVSRDRLLELFFQLLTPLGDVVDVVLETSHDSPSDAHFDLHRSDIDLPILASYLCEHDELLLNDGCFGVAVIAVDQPMEVQFDEHKTLVCYARDLRPFVDVFHAAEVSPRDNLRLVSDAPHLHYSRPEYAQQFGELAWRLGIGEGLPQVMGS